MDLIVQGIIKAFELIISFDPEVLGITWLSLKVSGTATFISLFIGVSIGTAVALANFRGKRLVISLINTGMGLPPVVVGLFVDLFLGLCGVFCGVSVRMCASGDGALVKTKRRRRRRNGV